MNIYSCIYPTPIPSLSLNLIITVLVYMYNCIILQLATDETMVSLYYSHINYASNAHLQATHKDDTQQFSKGGHIADEEERGGEEMRRRGTKEKRSLTSRFQPLLAPLSPPSPPPLCAIQMSRTLSGPHRSHHHSMS